MTPVVMMTNHCHEVSEGKLIRRNFMYKPKQDTAMINRQTANESPDILTNNNLATGNTLPQKNTQSIIITRVYIFFCI